MIESLRNHGDHGGAAAVYVVQAPQWHRAFGVTGAYVQEVRIVPCNNYLANTMCEMF